MDSPDSDTEEHDVNKLAFQVVRRAFCSEHVFKPMRKEDINKDILPNVPRRQKTALYESVMKKAQTILVNECGLKLVPLPAREFPSELKTREERLKEQVHTQTSAPPQKKVKLNDSDSPFSDLLGASAFMIESVLPKRLQALVADIKSPDARKYRTNTTIVLMMLVLDNGYMLKETLQSRLAQVLKMELAEFEDLTTKMVRHQFLLRKRVTVTEEYFALGPRAKIHLTPEGVQGVMRRLLGPDNYTKQVYAKIDSKLKAVNIGNVGPADP